MHETRESDGSTIAKNSSNKARGAPRGAEKGERRDATKGNPIRQNRDRTQGRASLQSALDRIRQVAKGDKEAKFTALWHHVYEVDHLRQAYFGLKPKAAAGVDGVTWEEYGEDLEKKLLDLSERLKRGAYRARPVRRVNIPKDDGRTRSIGVCTLEDKVVQRATAAVLGAIYEADFEGFSYGFRPGRSQHNALDAVSVGICQRKVNWVLDADVSGFFDTLDHDWLMKFVEHRIADKRMLRHLKKWLNAGVMDEGVRKASEEGVPQGGSICPLLANIYLHYVFDLWTNHWRDHQATGDVIVVRFADDFVVGFQRRQDAERFRSELEVRFQKFGLTLNPEKTHLIEFGRFAAENRRRRGQGKPKTFGFLGFTHYCGTTRKGKFALKRRTKAKKKNKKLKEVYVELRRRINWKVPVVGKWLASVLRGHYGYYGVPHNYPALEQMYDAVVKLWKKVLSRRSQRAHITWERMNRIARRWLPRPRILHPYPNQRLRVTTRGRSPVH
jgi:RNA-directed DNA polymerase